MSIIDKDNIYHRGLRLAGIGVMSVTSTLWSWLSGFLFALTYLPSHVAETIKELGRDSHFSYLESEEIDRILKEKGMYKDFLAGKIQCYICGTEIKHGSIGVMFFQNGFPNFTCENSCCFSRLMEERARKQYA